MLPGNSKWSTLQLDRATHARQVEELLHKMRMNGIGQDNEEEFEIAKHYYLALRRVSDRLGKLCHSLSKSKWFVDHHTKEIHWEGSPFSEDLIDQIVDCYSAVERFLDDINNLENSISRRAKGRSNSKSTKGFRELATIPSNFIKHNSTHLSLCAALVRLCSTDNSECTLVLPYVEFCQLLDSRFQPIDRNQRALRPRGFSELAFELLSVVERRSLALHLFLEDELNHQISSEGDYRASVFLEKALAAARDLPLYSIDAHTRKHRIRIEDAWKNYPNENSTMPRGTREVGWIYFTRAQTSWWGTLPAVANRGTTQLRSFGYYSWLTQQP